MNGRVSVFLARVLVAFLAVVWAMTAAASSNSPNAHSQNFEDCKDNFAGATPAMAMNIQDIYPLCFVGFATLYSGVGKTALYSAHHLTKNEIAKARQLPRQNNFHPETRLPKALQVSTQSYKGYDFDRGHLMPNGDADNVDMQFDSFSFANIVPQNALHNRGVWRSIESQTRYVIYGNGEGYVVTGTAFLSPQFMGDVAIPTHLYKAVFLPAQNVAGVYFSPNDESGTYEIISVQDLQARTGINPFPAQTPTFNPQPFELNSHSDDTTTAQTPAETGDIEFWVAVIQILISLWQKLTA